MKQKDVFKKIGGIIQELSDQYEYLKTVEDDLNDLELELFVSNAHFLTDHIEILCKLNLQNKFKRPALPHIEKPELPEVTVVTSQQKFFEPVVQQMKHADTFKLTKPAKPIAKVADIKSGKPLTPETFKPTEDEAFKPIEGELIKPVEAEPIPEIDLTTETLQEAYSEIQEEPETIRHELILDEADTWEDEDERRLDDEPIAIIDADDTLSTDTEVIAGPIIPPPVDKKNEAANHADEADEVLTVNQKMSSQQGDKAISKTDQLAIKPISDIKLAITLNDKLLYVKDLFNGYNLAYSEAIEILNRFSSFDEAARFLKTNYVTKNNWDSKPATTEKFYTLLKRRYA